jgi:predicted butyrate kinase (DUF1464 family)
VFTPGAIHLASVPEYRKVNRVDMGTADKVCSAALAISEQAVRAGVAAPEVSLILVEMGGAFTAALAVDRGRIVDGVGGSSGPIGLRSAGALDGEVAFLAGAVSKAMLFGGGALAVRGEAGREGVPSDLAHPTFARGRMAWDAYAEGIAKTIAALRISVPDPQAIILSGRLAAIDGLVEALVPRLGTDSPVHRLAGFARHAKQAAQGAALVADGLAGGAHAPLVETMGLRAAHGTVLDHLYVIPAAAARRRIGLG